MLKTEKTSTYPSFKQCNNGCHDLQSQVQVNKPETNFLYFTVSKKLAMTS